MFRSYQPDGVSMMDSGEYDLNRLIAPHKEARFIEDYWGRRHLHIERDSKRYFQPLLSLRDFDEILTSSNIRYPGIRMARNGQVIDSQSFTRKRGSYVDVAQVIDEYDKGATVILESLDHSWEPLIQLVRRMEVQFQFSAQANAYLTPKNAQGFAPHSDSHDVFILQTAGSKCWQIYDWTEDQAKAKGNLTCDDLGKPLFETVLNAGDTLYIPKGQIHQAKTSTEVSLHITLGVHSISWYKFMCEIFTQSLQEVCEKDASYHRSIPMHSVENVDEVSGRWMRVMHSIQDHSDLTRMIERMQNKAVRRRQPWLKGQLFELQRLDSISEATKVYVRRDVIARVFADQNLVYLIFDGKEISFPLVIEPYLEFLLKQNHFKVSDLPDSLEENSKIVLIRRLVKEGLLKIDSAA